MIDTWLIGYLIRIRMSGSLILQPYLASNNFSFSISTTIRCKRSGCLYKVQLQNLKWKVLYAIKFILESLNRKLAISFLVRVKCFLFRLPARLDGVSETAIKKMSEHKTIEDWLELSEEFRESNPLDKKGKRRVCLWNFNKGGFED